MVNATVNECKGILKDFESKYSINEDLISICFIIWIGQNEVEIYFTENETGNDWGTWHAFAMW